MESCNIASQWDQPFTQHHVHALTTPQLSVNEIANAIYLQPILRGVLTCLKPLFNFTAMTMSENSTLSNVKKKSMSEVYDSFTSRMYKGTATLQKQSPVLNAKELVAHYKLQLVCHSPFGIGAVIPKDEGHL